MRQINQNLFHQGKFLVLLVLTVATLSQCTIQKRVHQKGWYVSFRKPIHASTNTAKTKQTRELAAVDSIQAIAPDSPELVRQTSVPLLFQDSIVEPQVEILPVAESVDLMLPIVTDTLKKGRQNKQHADPEKEPNLKRQKTVKIIVIAVFILLLLAVLIPGFISFSATASASKMLYFSVVILLMLLVLILAFIAAETSKINKTKKARESADKAEKAKQIKREPTQEELQKLKRMQKKRAIALSVFFTVAAAMILFFTFPIVEIPFFIFCCVLLLGLLLAVWSYTWRKPKLIEVTVSEEPEEEPEVIVAPEKPALTEKERRRKKLKGIIFFSIFGLGVAIIGFLISSN